MHTFHIPVLGLGFSIDTPLKVARYGISSVVSIVDDELTERMREYHSIQNSLPYTPIVKNTPDHRARRITAYLNLLNKLVQQQFNELKRQPFREGKDIDKYFELLPETSPLKQYYLKMLEMSEPQRKALMQDKLRNSMQPGSIDVNIMSKVDKVNYDKHGHSLGDIYTDALASLRGFALSDVKGALTLSAGMNPKLYSYLENFDCFFPDANGVIPKKVILKVSDFRSALIQAKFLAKKGIWVHEFRIESGLNCGGHAFATDGLLLGPILEEFKLRREEMKNELQDIYFPALAAKGYKYVTIPTQRVSVQGGIGTAKEHEFLRYNYQLDATGWGSPFLLVPEATNVDNDTLQNLAIAGKDDFYVSAASPLGILFNNFRKSTAEQLRVQRIEKGRPGSPCTKKFLITNTEFTEQPICTASRQYQHLKIEQLQNAGLEPVELQRQVDAVTEKICLCEGLCTSAYIKNDMLHRRDSKAVAICPGPNIAYFSGIYSLREMVNHIYGKLNLLTNVSRPNVFINELNLYIDHLKKDMAAHANTIDLKKKNYLLKFKTQLTAGINYYKELIPTLTNQTIEYLDEMKHHLLACEMRLNALHI
ncbi:hypothetical protein EOD41_02625 [Mucilaginibacter limnophilus]|uniref:Uncharacterized protein n=1 Tax=Mucilaginibacter limnophilus TaxID=1932778 RepID=A0A437MYZ8_9SPHI|nr:hypothetical protein [Mucilaginibacter limnophilus]RVU02849.1 hypothetical protein EOD41_02625 [Mucilaginibacter limnophilus]